MVGLVALRQGARQGMVVTVGAAALCGLVAVGGIGTPVPAIALVFALWLPVWLCAQVLRATQSQGAMLATTGALAALFAVGMRAATGDVQAWWRTWSQTALEHATGRADVVDPAVLDRAASMMNGLASSGIVLHLALTLLIARWWQAILYNPGGFQTEFCRLRLPGLLALPVAVAAVFESMRFMQGGSVDLVTDFLFVALTLYLFQGLAVTHHYVRARKRSGNWLIALYVALVVVWPSTALVLAAVGVADSVTDFRRLKRPPMELDERK